MDIFNWFSLATATTNCIMIVLNYRSYKKMRDQASDNLNKSNRYLSDSKEIYSMAERYKEKLLNYCDECGVLKKLMK